MEIIFQCFFTVGVVLVFLVIMEKKNNKRMGQLTEYLMKVQDRLELPEMQTVGEDQFGILQSEIYKLVALLKEQSSAAIKEKEYLAKMLSDISHQIKTPMTSITIMTDLLKNPELSEEKRLEFVSKIDSQVSRTTWLVRNLLTLSELEADVLKLKKESVNVYGMLKKIVDSFGIIVELKEVRMVMESRENIFVLCDERWTMEAISNIVKNCIEHTDPGGCIRIGVEQNNISTKITVKDSGKGIAKEHLPHIFNRFYKVDTNSKNSVGIGLAISKQVILLQNGTIDVESQLGEGTRFLIKLYQV